MPDDSIVLNYQPDYSYEYYYSNKLRPGKYKILVQAEVNEIKSEIVSKEITLKERENPKILCWNLENQQYFLAGSSEVKAKCEVAGMKDEKIFAKLSDLFPSVPDDYDYPCSIDNNEILTCDFTRNTKSRHFIYFAIMDKSHEHVLSYVSLPIALYNKLNIHDLGLVNSNQVIKQTDRVEFKITIENNNDDDLKAMAAIVASSIDHMPDNATEFTLSQMDEQSPNEYILSDFVIPYDLAAGDYKLLVQIKQYGEVYNAASSTFHVNINENHFYCESQRTFWNAEAFNIDNGAIIDFKCFNYSGSDLEITAKINDKSYHCSSLSDTGTVKCYIDWSIARKYNEYEVILTDNHKQILGKSKVTLNLIKTPVISKFHVIPKTPNGVIYNDDYNQTFIVSLQGVKPNAIKRCEIESVGLDLRIPINLTAINDENYQFNLTLPASDSSRISKYDLIFSVVNIFDKTGSKKLTIEIIPRIFPLECSLVSDKKIFTASNIFITCNSPSYDKLYYTFNNKDYYPLEQGYHDYIPATDITSIVKEVHIAILYRQNLDEVYNTTIIPITIYPTPRISHLVSTDAKTKFIADEEIHFIFTKEVFGEFEKAKIDYGFSEPGSTHVREYWMTYHSQPKPVPGSSNYSVTVLIPDSDEYVGNNTFKLKFTDICDQEIIIESESNFIILHHYKIDENSIDLPEQNAENKVYQTGESFKIVFTLSNLDEDWKTNLKFGVKFGNGKMHIIDHYKSEELENQKKVSSSSEKRIELDIPIPDDIDVAESGVTQMQIFTLDKDENIISKPIIKTIKVNPKPKSTPDSSKDGKKLGPGGVAGIVIGVIIIIAAVAAGAFFILKAKQAKEAEISENGEEPQDPIEDA